MKRESGGGTGAEVERRRILTALDSRTRRSMKRTKEVDRKATKSYYWELISLFLRFALLEFKFPNGTSTPEDEAVIWIQ